MSVSFRLIIRALALLLTTTTLGVGLASTATAADTGVVEGQVSTSNGGDVVGLLTLHHWVGDGFTEGPTLDLNGKSPVRYSFPDLPVGDYYVSFEDTAGSYLPGFGSPATAVPDSLDDPGVVHVDATTAASNIILKPAAPLQQLTGSVVSTAGPGIDDVYIVASLVTPNGGRKYADNALTAANGSFQLSLRPGTYALDIEDIHQRYGNIVSNVTITSGQSTIPAITLSPLQTWTFNGSIKDNAGNGIAQARVQLYALRGVVGDWWGYDPGPVVTTDANGSYRFTGLKHNEYYALGGSAYGRHAAVLGGGTDPTTGTTFRANQNRNLDDLHLEAATGLRGSVSSVFGPTEDVDVELLRWDAGTSTFVDADAVASDGDGAYRFDDLAPGAYTLHFDPTGAAGQLRSAWLGGSKATSPASPGVVDVDDTPADLVEDVTLAPRQVATGTLTNDTGDLLPGGRVTAYVYDGESASWTEYASALAGSDGAFDVPVPASSTVTFGLAHTGYPTRFYDGGPDLPVTPTSQNSRDTLADGDLALGIQELAPHTQFATGSVTGTGPLAGATVTSYRRSGSSWVEFDEVTTAADGAFSVAVPGNSRVTFRFAKSGYVARYLGGGTTAPATPTDANSRLIGLSGGTDLGAQKLAAMTTPPPAKLKSTTAAKLAKTRIRKGRSTSVTFTVKVAGLAGPTGVLDVYDGSKRIKRVTLTAGQKGVVKVKLKKPSKGKHKIRATYAGSSRVLGSTSPTVTLKVTRR